MRYPKPDRSFGPIQIILLIALGVIIIVGIYFGAVYKKAYKVVHVSWTASSYLKQRTQVHSSDWCPPDHEAFNVQKSRKFRNMRDCLCSTDSEGNKSCSKCPNYDDWCEYDWYDWPIIKTLSNTKEPLSTPEWPIIKPIENQRVDTDIVFEAVFKDEDGNLMEYKAKSLEELRRYEIGAWWKVSRTFGVGFVPLNVLQGEGE